MGEYGAIGYASFGVEHILDQNGNVVPPAQLIADSCRAVAEAIQLLVRYQGTDSIHAIVQEENQAGHFLEIDGWYGWRLWDMARPAL